MKLISMTDFVLNIRNRTTTELCEYMPKVFIAPKWNGSQDEMIKDILAFDAIKFKVIGEYAKFLKQVLNLGMFVPCDEEGNILKEPLNYNKWIKKELNTPYWLDLSKYEQYKQAKERVLFEDVYGIEYIENIILDRCNTIEDLLSLKIVSFELTKSAQKQSGL